MIPEARKLHNSYPEFAQILNADVWKRIKISKKNVKEIMDD